MEALANPKALSLDEVKDKIKKMDHMQRQLNDLNEMLESLYVMKRAPGVQTVGGTISTGIYVDVPASVAYTLVKERYDAVAKAYNQCAVVIGVELIPKKGE